MLSIILALLFTFNLILFSKIHLIHIPDVFALLLAVLALQNKNCVKFLTHPAFAFLFIIAVISLWNMILYEFDKPYWFYHILRFNIYFLAGMYIGGLVPVSRIMVWCGIFVVLGGASVVLETVRPEMFPDWFNSAKTGGNWYLKYEFELHSSRRSGIYGNFQEVGTLMGFACVVALSYLKERLTLARLSIILIVLLAAIAGIFHASVRTAGVFVLVGTLAMIVVLILVSGVNVLHYLRRCLVLVPLITIAGFLLALVIIDQAVERGISIQLVALNNKMGELVDLLSGGDVSSWEGTKVSMFLPSSVYVLLFGNGGQPFIFHGVKSDVGYVQLIWGIGIFGLASILLLYGWMFRKSLKSFCQTRSPLSLGLIGVISALMVINLKGLYFLGLRSGGDLVPVLFAMMLTENLSGSLARADGVSGTHLRNKWRKGVGVVFGRRPFGNHLYKE